MAPTKRPAAGASGAPAKKAHVARGFAKKCDAICEVVLQAEELSLDTRKMLKAGLAESIKPAKDLRHPYQNKIVGWVQEAVNSVEASLKAGVTTAEAAVAAVASKKEGVDAELGSAKAAADAKTEAVAGKKTAVHEAETALKEAKAALTEATKAETEGNAELVTVEEKKAAYEEALNGVFLKLKAGGVPAEEEKELLEKVTATGGEMELDQSMLTSLPSALGKVPDARGQFDLMVVDSFEAELNKRLAATNATLEAGAPAKQERAAAVEAATAKIEAATTAVATAKEELQAAKAEKDTADAAAKDANKAVKDAAAELKAAEKTLKDATSDLADLKKGAMESLKELVEYDGTVKHSQYKYIDGVRYEYDLLDMVGDEEISQETAEKLFDKAMDGAVITPTEKRTIRYILKEKGFVGDAKNFLETKIGTSWYQTIDGTQYERILLTIAANEAKPFSEESADKLWASAQDGGQVTACEKRTLEYILAHNEFVHEAKILMQARVAGLAVEEE